MMVALRSLKPDETPSEKPKSVAEAAESGDRLALLVALRSRIARTVSSDDCPPRDLASLTRRLADVAKEIEALTAAARQEAAESGEAPADAEFDAAAI